MPEAQTVLDRITDVVFAVDANGRLTSVNPAAAELFGSPAADLIGRTIDEALPAWAVRLRQQCDAAIATGSIVVLHESHPRSGHEYQLRLFPSADGVTAYGVSDADLESTVGSRGDGAPAASPDDDREGETRLRTEVVRTLSHDLKTPLNAIRLSAELIGELAAGSGEIPAIAARVVSIADRMNRLISGLLDADRLNEGRRLPIDLEAVPTASIARDACELFELAASQRKIRLECAVADGCPAVWADEDRILQVLWNLIGNAVKLTPPSGQVRVRVEPDGPAVRFSVSDAGPGIRDEDMSRLFDPYWQEKRTARLGTGLGLPTSKAIVVAHGGRIWVETRRGEGSTFHFTIPAVASHG